MYKHTNSMGGGYVTPILKTVPVQTQLGFAASPAVSASFNGPTDDGLYTYSW